MRERKPSRPQLIVALDCPSMRAASEAVSDLPGSVQWFKVGLELFCSAGPVAIDMLRSKRKRVFLDLKLHDIPNTVARTVGAVAGRGASLLTVHALGGGTMLRAASEAASAFGPRAPKIIAVTILTSHSQQDIESIGIRRKLSAQAMRLAELALASGADGLVASCAEAGLLRRNFGRDFILVVPGIRPAGADSQDQKRTATPAAAAEAGADFIVVGRPIMAARDPRAAASSILDEIKRGKTGPA